MSDFVEQCRREWKRLGVPDPVANEMAADLEADLREAEAEGASAEAVLGSSVFDPQAFAAAWATARGVTAAPPPARERRSALPFKLLLVVGVALVGFVAVALLLGLPHKTVVRQGGFFPPPRPQLILPGSGQAVQVRESAGVGELPVHAILLIMGVLGVALVLWSAKGAGRWSGPRT